MNISIIILNWNGSHLLKECLPSVCAAAAFYTEGSCEIIVADNGSNDRSREFVENNFSSVRFLAFGKNLGSAAATNKGIREARYSAVVCLNNDVIVEKNFIAPLTRHFQDTNVFCSASKMLLPDGKTLNFGKARASFRYGFFLRAITDVPAAQPSLYGSSGGMMLDRDKFFALGAFDEEMKVYWEDCDICYRAWKRGWKTIYEPASVMYHKFHATNSATLGTHGIDLISGRNYVYFIIKNIHDPWLCCAQALSYPFLLLALVISGKAYFAWGMITAARDFHGYLGKRIHLKRSAVFSDRQVLRKSAAI